MIATTWLRKKILTCGIAKRAAAPQILLRAHFAACEHNIFTTHLCNGGVALEAVSQSLAAFNAQNVPIDVELYSTQTKNWAHKFKCK